jgi:hypothetical protein
MRQLLRYTVRQPRQIDDRRDVHFSPEGGVGCAHYSVLKNCNNTARRAVSRAWQAVIIGFAIVP